MSFLLALLPATLLAAFAYVVLYCSTKEDGAVRTFGEALAVLLFVIAAAPLLLGTYLTAQGVSPGDLMAQHMSSFYVQK
jgi:hypothetical protein